MDNFEEWLSSFKSRKDPITKYKFKLLDLYGIDLFSKDGKLLVGDDLFKDKSPMKVEILKRYLYCRGIDIDELYGCEIDINQYHKYLQSISILDEKTKVPKLNWDKLNNKI